MRRAKHRLAIGHAGTADEVVVDSEGRWTEGGRWWQEVWGLLAPPRRDERLALGDAISAVAELPRDTAVTTVDLLRSSGNGVLLDGTYDITGIGGGDGPILRLTLKRHARDRVG